MNILFVMLHPGYVRNYEGVLRQLVAEGHRVHIADELGRNKMGESVLGQRLAEALPAITLGRAAVPEPTYWFRAMRIGRLLRDYLRYLDPRFAQAAALRARAAQVVPPVFLPLLRLCDRLGARWAAAFDGALSAAERVAPLSPAILSFLRAQHPDVLLVTPLVEPGSTQVDYIKGAQALGIPTALCVASWDNLTNMGLMRVVPDRVFVWNAAQRQEAIELHGVPSERVVVTGAQLFDQWFSWRPSRTREDFCRAVGLEPDRPFVLYLGSSSFLAPNEAEFGGRWVAALRQSDDPAVAGAGILIRPHPSNGTLWHGHDFSAWRQTAIWPPPGADMFAPEFKHDLFDSLYYSAVVVGINTSAQIEAAIVGRAVCTIEAPEFAHAQAGMPHYQHLVRGGLLRIASSLEEHVGQLGVIIRNPDEAAARGRDFVESFVRPFGLDVPATPRLTAAIVETAAARPAHPPAGAAAAGRSVARALLSPIAALAAWLPDRRPWWVYAIRVVLAVSVRLWTLPYRIATGVTIAGEQAAMLTEAARRWLRREGRQLGRGVRAGRAASRRLVKRARYLAGRAWHRAWHWRTAE